MKQFPKIPPKHVGSISAALELRVSKHFEFLKYLSWLLKTRSKQPKEGRLSAVLEYAHGYFQNL